MTRQEREAASIAAVNEIFQRLTFDRYEVRLALYQEVVFAATAYVISKEAGATSQRECYANMCAALDALPHVDYEALEVEHVV